MKRHVVLTAIATASFLFVADACNVNPWNTPDIEVNIGSGGAGSTSSSGSGNPGCTCTDDQNECTDDVVGPCPNGNPNECHTAIIHRECMLNDGALARCDSAGACTPCNECADAACAHRCVGQSCTANGDCANGQCVDGFCCDSACTGECNACDRVPGICKPLPVGMPGECPAGQLCGNNSACKETPKKPLGDLCAKNDSLCESGACVAQICVSVDGQPCAEHLECASRLCDPMTHMCVACGANVMCPDGAGCQNGRCQVLPGQPAANSMECKPPGAVADGLTCTLPVNAACTDNFECIYHDCNGAPNGKCAAACVVDAECPSGTLCNKDKGWCFLPPGSYCVIDDQCQGPVNVGKCSGFPRRCE